MASLIDRLVNSYGLNGEGRQAVELFHRIPSQFIGDVTYVCVLNACSHSGLVDQARAIFSKIAIKSDIIYTTMVSEISRFLLFLDKDRSSCVHLSYLLDRLSQSCRSFPRSTTTDDRVRA